MTGRIVVGVDGSDESRTALRWAVDEAERRAAIVEALIAWHLPSWFMLEGGGRAEHKRLSVALRDTAADKLDHWVRAAVGARPVRVEQLVVEQGAASALLEVSDGADLLVVGSRGLGGFRGLMLGSVSSQCVQHARCPVVIVPPETDRSTPDR